MYKFKRGVDFEKLAACHLTPSQNWNVKKIGAIFKEDTHKKSVFFSGRTTEGESINPAFLAQQLERKNKLLKSVSGK